jgi:hypothetical protein
MLKWSCPAQRYSAGVQPWIKEQPPPTVTPARAGGRWQGPGPGGRCLALGAVLNP